jgi:hypothetical protein
MAIIYNQQGHYDQALEIYESVLETKIRMCFVGTLRVPTWSCVFVIPRWWNEVFAGLLVQKTSKHV